jgi:hypothetical protein
VSTFDSYPTVYTAKISIFMKFRNIIAVIIGGNIPHTYVNKPYVQNAVFCNIKAVVDLHKVTTVLQRAKPKGMYMGFEGSQHCKYSTSTPDKETADSYKMSVTTDKMTVF